MVKLALTKEEGVKGKKELLRGLAVPPKGILKEKWVPLNRNKLYLKGIINFRYV